MKIFCGAGQDYQDPMKIETHHKITMDAAINQFNKKATYGPKTERIQYRDTLKEEFNVILVEMLQLNEERDPIAAIPQGYMMLVGVSFFILHKKFIFRKLISLTTYFLFFFIFEFIFYFLFTYFFLSYSLRRPISYVSSTIGFFVGRIQLHLNLILNTLTSVLDGVLC